MSTNHDRDRHGRVPERFSRSFVQIVDRPGGLRVDVAGVAVELSHDVALAAADALDDAVCVAYRRRGGGDRAADRDALTPGPISSRFVADDFRDGWSALLAEDATIKVSRDGQVELTVGTSTVVLDVEEAFAVADALDDRLYEQ